MYLFVFGSVKVNRYLWRIGFMVLIDWGKVINSFFEILYLLTIMITIIVIIITTRTIIIIIIIIIIMFSLIR